MKVEVLKVYLTEYKGGHFEGTAHISIPELRISMRGIYVQVYQDKWVINMPMKKFIDDTGALRKYPILCFDDPERKNLFEKAYRAEVKRYIEENILKPKS